MTEIKRADWLPFSDAHSIEVVSAAINFSEPLTEVSWKKVTRDADAIRKAAGLSETMPAIQFMIGAPPSPATGPPVSATLFMSSKAIDVSGMPRAPLETLTIGRAGLALQTTVYTRWDAFFERMRMLLVPPLRAALRSTGILSLRLEYKDSFRFVGDGPPIAARLLNLKSGLIAPHVFENEQLWHSHTGFFEQAAGCKERLVQINIDANVSADTGTPDVSFRSVTITTAVQNNLTSGGSESLDNEEELANSQIAMFDSLHQRSKDLFRQIISNETASQVGIK